MGIPWLLEKSFTEPEMPPPWAKAQLLIWDLRQALFKGMLRAWILPTLPRE